GPALGPVGVGQAVVGAGLIGGLVERGRQFERLPVGFRGRGGLVSSLQRCVWPSAFSAVSSPPRCPTARARSSARWLWSAACSYRPCSRWTCPKPRSAASSPARSRRHVLDPDRRDGWLRWADADRR